MFLKKSMTLVFGHMALFGSVFAHETSGEVAATGAYSTSQPIVINLQNQLTEEEKEEKDKLVFEIFNPIALFALNDAYSIVRHITGTLRRYPFKLALVVAFPLLNKAKDPNYKYPCTCVKDISRHFGLILENGTMPDDVRSAILDLMLADYASEVAKLTNDPSWVQ